MTGQSRPLLDAAMAYLEAGLCVLPANLAEKRVALGAWKPYQEQLPGEDEVRAWFTSSSDAVCIVAGAVSGNLEMIDFDVAGELYPAWAELVESRAPGLLERLVRERSQGGGKHVVYRVAEPVGGSAKLAQREVECPDGTAVVIAGKRHAPHRKAGRQGFGFSREPRSRRRATRCRPARSGRTRRRAACRRSGARRRPPRPPGAR